MNSAERIRTARRRLDERRAKTRAAEDELFDAIQQAATDGMSLATIAELAGLAKSRVGQITTGRARRS